jgi:hypothetical protein
MVNSSQFVSMNVGPGGWKRIQEEAAALGTHLNSRTAMAGKRGNKHSVTGPAGEIAVGHVFPDLKREHGNMDYDFLAPNGKRVDVKTRSTNSPPKDFFDVRIPAYSFEIQKCDAYVFSFAKWNPSNTALDEILIVGWCTKQEFGKISTLEKVDNARPQDSSFNQQEGGADLLFTQINRLNPMNTFKNYLCNIVEKGQK